MTNEPQFTTEDIRDLMEAVVAWEAKDASGELMEAMMLSLIPKTDDPITLAKLEQDQQERKRVREEERRVRQERSVLLRAKLLQLRDARQIAPFIDALSRPS